MVDFLIIYEHKARELEAICLIKAELERRGYSVEFSCTYDEDKIRSAKRRKAKVVVTPALYNDACLYGFVYSIAGFCKKVVNLQWEQALTNQDEADPSFYQNPKGYAIDALHLCWGEEPRNRLLRAGVKSDRAAVVGSVQMDFLRQEFSGLYLTKEDLAQQFGLDHTNEWVLFISSFTYVGMTDEEYNTEIKCMGPRLHDFLRLSILSKQEIIKWLEAAIKRYPGRMFIYRPHPSENGDLSLSEIEAKHKNFRVIRDFSVKQWIKCSNKIFTWYSTAAAEVYFSGKSCSILRPVEIPYEWDVSVYRNAHTISDVNCFLQGIEKADDSFPLSETLLRDYFQVKDTTPAYVRLCDVLERVLDSKDYDMRKHRSFILIYIYFQQIRHRLFFLIKEALAGINYQKLFMNNRWLNKKMENHLAVMDRLRRDCGKNQASDRDFADIFFKIQGIINRAVPLK